MKIHTFPDLQGPFCKWQVTATRSDQTLAKRWTESAQQIYEEAVKLPNDDLKVISCLRNHEFQPNLYWGWAGVDVHKQESLSSLSIWVQGKTENLFFLAIGFKSSKINSTIIRTSKPRNVLPNVYRHHEFLHSFWAVAAALVYHLSVQGPVCSPFARAPGSSRHVTHRTRHREQTAAEPSKLEQSQVFFVTSLFYKGAAKSEQTTERKKRAYFCFRSFNYPVLKQARNSSVLGETPAVGQGKISH